MSFDLSELATTKDTFTVQLRHPVTEEKIYDGGDVNKPVTITILGKSSKEFRNTQAGQQNERFKNSGKVAITSEKIQADYSALLAAVTVGSDNLKYNGTENVDFVELYNDPNLSWVRDQVSVELENLANFLAS